MEQIITEQQCLGYTNAYECPNVEIIEVNVECGFCLSGELDSNNENYTPVVGSWD